MFRSSGKDVYGVSYSRTPSNLGEESPTLGDLSSNNTPEMPHRTKAKKAVRKTSKDHHYRSTKSRGRTPPSTSSAAARDDVDQSVFPIRTPDKEGFLGPLTDLLEEEITLPGESRQNSAEKGGKNWAYLPQHRKSPTSSTSSSSSSGASSTSASSAVAALGAVAAPPDASSPSVPWHQQVAETLNLTGRRTSREEDNSDPGEPEEQVEGAGAVDDEALAAARSEENKKRALSAKSHIFRKGKIEASKYVQIQSILKHATHPSRGRKGTSSHFLLSFATFLFRTSAQSAQSRPWSAHESRLQADPIFHMRQRHWEGLISGKKRLHRGQLLPGSTSEEEIKDQLRKGARSKTQPKQPQTCWSECTSPRKQVRISVPPVTSERTASDRGSTESGSGGDPTGPIIQAIRDELQKFHRPKSPNLSGISIINDPDLLKKESDA